MNNKVITITDARKDIFNIVEDVQKPNTIYTLTVEGAPQAVLISKEEYDAIMTTMEELYDPDFVRDIQESREAIKRGEYTTWDEVKQELDLIAEPAFLISDNKQKYNAKKTNKCISPKRRKKVRNNIGK